MVVVVDMRGGGGCGCGVDDVRDWRTLVIAAVGLADDASLQKTALFSFGGW